MSELARAFGELLADGQKPQTPTAVQEDGLREAVNALREQLQAAQGRETAAQEREMWLKDQLEAAQARIMELERRLMPLALPEKSGFFARFFGKQHRGKCVI
jgi:chromosome segregation ATPase